MKCLLSPQTRLQLPPHCFSPNIQYILNLCPTASPVPFLWFLSAHLTPSLIPQHPTNCFMPFLLSCSQLAFFQSCTPFHLLHVHLPACLSAPDFQSGWLPDSSRKNLGQSRRLLLSTPQLSTVLVHYHLEGRPVKTLFQPYQSQQTTHTFPGEFFGKPIQSAKFYVSSP